MNQNRACFVLRTLAETVLCGQDMQSVSHEHFNRRGTAPHDRAWLVGFLASLSSRAARRREANWCGSKGICQ